MYLNILWVLTDIGFLPAVSHDTPAKHKNSARLRTDYINLDLCKWGRESYEPIPRTTESDQYLIPMDHPFASKTPLFVNVGTVELNYDEVKVFAERMMAVQGNDVCYLETKDAPHDIILAGIFTGFVRQAEVAAKRAGEHFGLSRNEGL